MADITRTSFRRITDGGYVNYRETVDPVSSRPTPPLVRGAWIEFPDGSRFRRPTDYGRSELIQEDGNPGVHQGRYWYGDPYSYVTSPGGYATWEFFSGNWIYRYNSALDIPNLLAAPSFNTMEENESITKSLNKIADQKANIGENLATFGLTVKLIANPVQGIINLTKKLREEKDLWPLIHRSYRDWTRGKVAKRLTDAYLAYVYGVAPLVADTYGLIELAKEYGKKPLLLNGTATAERYSSPSDQYVSNYTYERTESFTNMVARSRTRTTIWAKISDQHAGLRTLNQLGLTNPASLAWELVPYSFVVDWLLPIGPVLQAMTAPAGLDFVAGSTSRRVKAYWDYDISKWPPYGVSYDNDSHATGKFRYNGYGRKVHTFWPTPGLWIAPDPLGLSRDKSDRVFKALALSISRLPYL